MRLANGPIYTRKAFPLLPTTPMCNPPDSGYAFQPFFLLQNRRTNANNCASNSHPPPFFLYLFVFFPLTFFPLRCIFLWSNLLTRYSHLFFFRPLKKKKKNPPVIFYPSIFCCCSPLSLLCAPVIGLSMHLLLLDWLSSLFTVLHGSISRQLYFFC